MTDMAQYAKDYANAPFEDKRVEMRRNYVLQTIVKYPHERILEVGCGMNPWFLHFHKFKEWVLIEAADVFFKNAKSLAGENVRCIQGFAEECISQLANTHFDWIIISSLLHEIENPAKLLNAIKTVCARNTMVHVNVPNANSFHRLIGKEMGIIRDEFSFSDSNHTMQQHAVFSMETLRTLLVNTGFEIVNAATDFVKPFSHAQMQRCVEAGIINQDYLNALSNMVKYIPEMGSEIYVNCRLDV